MLLVLVVSLASMSDLAAAPRATPAWVPQCVAALERAGAEYAQLRGQRVRVTTEIAPTEDHRPCAEPVVDRIDFEMPSPRDKDGNPIYTGGIERRQDDGQRPMAWHAFMSARALEHVRYDTGRSASTIVRDAKAPDAVFFSSVFMRALDECFASAPPAPAPPTPTAPDDAARGELCSRDAPAEPLAKCKDAELAAFELEHMCTVQSDYIGIAGSPGRTWPALARITGLGAASEAILLRLARSPNSTTRAVAAVGLKRLASDSARDAFHRLAGDNEPTRRMDGCLMSEAPVSSFAK